MVPPRWMCSIAARPAAELAAGGRAVGERSMNRLLHELGYSLQANRKTRKGRQPPGRDAQLQQIYAQVRACQRVEQAVVSVDTKKIFHEPDPSIPMM